MALKALNSIIHSLSKNNTNSTPKQSPPAQTPYDVIIVGGGIAGISAAYTLSQHNLNCCLLEARDKLGGRCQSEQWAKNISIDYGPQWIHHVPRRNPSQHALIAFVKKQLNMDIEEDFLQTESNESRTHHRRRLNWDETTKQAIPKQVYDVITNSIGGAHEVVLHKRYSAKHKHYSIFDALQPTYHATMHPERLQQELATMKEYMTGNDHVDVDVALMERCVDKYLCVCECADAKLTEESLYHYLDDDLDGYNMYMQGRYGELIKMISDRLLQSKCVQVGYQHIVQSVTYHHGAPQQSDEYDMEVVAVDGSDENKVKKYTAKHVIVCVPVGCLKARTIEFVPKLKETFWKCVDDGIGITNCDKLILYFDGQFAERNNVTFINLINKQERYKVNESIAPQHQNYGFGFRLGVDYKDRKKHNIWVIFISPHFWDPRWNAYENEQQAEEKKENDGEFIEKQNQLILQDTLRIFKDMFGGGKEKQFPKLKRYHVTRWDVDEYTRGCWEFMKVGGNGKHDCQRIAEAADIFELGDSHAVKVMHMDETKQPDNNREKKLQFAGSYANAEGIGTVYAAFVCATNAANNIIQLHSK